MYVLTRMCGDDCCHYVMSALGAVPGCPCRVEWHLRRRDRVSSFDHTTTRLVVIIACTLLEGWNIRIYRGDMPCAGLIKCFSVEVSSDVRAGGSQHRLHTVGQSAFVASCKLIRRTFYAGRMHVGKCRRHGVYVLAYMRIADGELREPDARRGRWDSRMP